MPQEFHQARRHGFSCDSSVPRFFDAEAWLVGPHQFVIHTTKQRTKIAKVKSVVIRIVLVVIMHIIIVIVIVVISRR